MMMQKNLHEHVQKALSSSKRNWGGSAIQGLLLDFGALEKFNFLKTKNMLFLLTSGMLVRFGGIGGMRILVDWKDTSKPDEVRRRQTAERVFVEVVGTLLATYMVLQAGIDLTGKGLGVANEVVSAIGHKMRTPQQWEKALNSSNMFSRTLAHVLKPRSLNPRVLLEKVQALEASGQIQPSEKEAFVKAVLDTTERHTPFNMGLNTAERSALGDWNVSSFAKALKKRGGERLYAETCLPEGGLTVEGLMKQEVGQYFARTNVAGVIASISGGVLSAWLSGGPIQHANDVVFRPWYLHHMRMQQEKQAALKAKQLADMPKNAGFTPPNSPPKFADGTPVRNAIHPFKRRDFDAKTTMHPRVLAPKTPRPSNGGVTL
jgi:hypothetical protein